MLRSSAGRRPLLPQLLITLVLASTRVRAGEDDRPQLPESILVESATDIDAAEGGELECELNAGRLGAHSGGAQSAQASLEVEWRALRELGARFEPSFSEERDSIGRSRRRQLDVRGALALALWHDFARDRHLQLELLGRSRDTTSGFDPAETELPFALDLVGAQRFGRWTVRSTVGAEAGGAFARLPLHTDAALLTGVTRDESYGFFALDARADWARRAPLVLAPEVIAVLTRVGLPFRLGVSLPVHVGSSAIEPSYGLLLRLSLLTGREAEE